VSRRKPSLDAVFLPYLEALRACGFQPFVEDFLSCMFVPLEGERDVIMGRPDDEESYVAISHENGATQEPIDEEWPNDWKALSPATVAGWIKREVDRRGYVPGTSKRYTICHCCGASFYTTKPHDPERDAGYGTCEACHERVAGSWHKHGFPGERPITIAEARARLAKYA
jgi:hypothetical protein